MNNLMYLSNLNRAGNTPVVSHSLKHLSEYHVSNTVDRLKEMLYFIPGCVLPLQEAALCPESSNFVLCFPCPCYFLMPPQCQFSNDLKPFICHALLLMKGHTIFLLH